MKESTLPLDPNVKLPAAVRAAAARSNEIIQNIKDGQVTFESNEPFEASKSADEPVGSIIPAQPAAKQVEEQEEPAEIQAQEPAARSAEKPAKSDSEERPERDFNAMKGRYDRAQEQIKDLSEQIRNLHGVIATMQVQAPSAPTPELQAERLITDEEARDYGDDFLKVVGKKAKEELVPIIQAQANKIAELEKRVQGVGNVVAQDAHTKLLNNLDEKLPNWRELNTNDDFLTWLRLPDPYSGAIRHDMLKAAYAAGNASRVLAFFNGFLAEEAAVDPARGDPDVPTETVAKVPLAKLAAPGRAKTAAGNAAPAEKPIFTRAQIATFYGDVANGKYRGRDADKNKLEAQIFAAQREGRIR